MSPVRPHSPSPSEAQCNLIDALGGPTTVAEIISEKYGHDYSPQMVSNWKRRGIPFAFRPHLAEIARRAGAAVPDGFLDDAAA